MMKNVNRTILDCYTDEPAGLGVPPYIGTYPRYITGYFFEQDGIIPEYITIDDLRLFFSKKKKKETRISQKTDIKTYNLTGDNARTGDVLNKTDELIIIIGVHTPGKYLSAVPGTLREITPMLKDLKCRKILTGPVLYGTQLEGGRFPEKVPHFVDSIMDSGFDYKSVKRYSLSGAAVLNQIPDMRIAEIETAKGCLRNPGCSFCTEPIKNKVESREIKSIVNEIKALCRYGIKNFRLGKQSCFYSYPDPITLLREIREISGVDILHIDNVNPTMVITKRGVEITKAIAKYCSDGNIAAFGVESFDEDVARANNLNCTPKTALRAVEIINKYGNEVGERGLHKFLPGINILFGLIDESRKTIDENIKYLSLILSKGFLLRRINIRQVIPFEGTLLYSKAGNKFLRKNRKYYWGWRDRIRKEIDLNMLKRVFPIGSILKEVRTEIYDGNTTFGRQIGTYPIIIGIKRRILLKEFVNIKVSGHMLRSITGEPL